MTNGCILEEEVGEFWWMGMVLRVAATSVARAMGEGAQEEASQHCQELF